MEIHSGATCGVMSDGVQKYLILHCLESIFHLSDKELESYLYINEALCPSINVTVIDGGYY